MIIQLSKSYLLFWGFSLCAFSGVCQSNYQVGVLGVRAVYSHLVFEGYGIILQAGKMVNPRVAIGIKPYFVAEKNPRPATPESSIRAGVAGYSKIYFLKKQNLDVFFISSLGTGIHRRRSPLIDYSCPSYWNVLATVGTGINIKMNEELFFELNLEYLNMRGICSFPLHFTSHHLLPSLGLIYYLEK